MSSLSKQNSQHNGSTACCSPPVRQASLLLVSYGDCDVSEQVQAVVEGHAAALLGAQEAVVIPAVVQCFVNGASAREHSFPPL